MQKSLIKCGVVGGIVVFIWGMISWMVLPWHTMTMNKFTHEELVAHVIEQNAPKSGIYVFPYMHTGSSSEKESKKEMTEAKEMMKTGPLVFASVKLGGMHGGLVRHIIGSLVIQIVGALLISWLLFQTKGLKYFKQVWFVASVGLVVGILGHLPAWNWMGFAWNYTLVCVLDLLIGWFLAGLVIAKLAKR